MLDLDVIWRNRPPPRPGLLGSAGSRRDAPPALPAIALGFALGVFIGLGRLGHAVDPDPATVYVELFRGVPLVMGSSGCGSSCRWRSGRPSRSSGGPGRLRRLRGAYLGEIARAVSSRCARAVGRPPPSALRSRAMGHVILPQALATCSPPVTRSSCCQGNVAGVDHRSWTDQAAQFVNNREIRPFELYGFIACLLGLTTRCRVRPVPGAAATPG